MARRKLSRETVQAAAQKWSANYAGSQAAITAGVNNPARDPTAAAIAAQDRLLANLTQAFTSGRWAKALAQAGLKGWQNGMLQKTIPSLGTRATAGQPHVAAFLQAWSAFIDQTRASLPPRGTYEQNKQRATSWIDAEHAVKGKYKSVWRGGM